jgi:hypothetical protein
MPDLDFIVESADVARYAVSPLLLFRLRVTNRCAGEEVASVGLQCQIQIETVRRTYRPGEQARLIDLFGAPSRWSQTLRTMLWTHTSAMIPPFTGDSTIELPVPCTFDFNVAATRFFGALEEGEVPLTLQFSGSVFYRDSDGALQVSRIPWHKEAAFRLPVSTWQAMMELYYPNGAWLFIRRDVFDRLARYRSERGLTGWDEALDSLLERTGAPEQELGNPSAGVR